MSAVVQDQWVREREERARDDELDTLEQALAVQSKRLMWVHVQLASGVSIEIIGVAVWMWFRMSVDEYSTACVLLVCIGALLVWHGSHRHARISKLLQQAEHAVADWLRVHAREGRQ